MFIYLFDFVCLSLAQSNSRALLDTRVEEIEIISSGDEYDNAGVKEESDAESNISTAETIVSTPDIKCTEFGSI